MAVTTITIADHMLVTPQTYMTGVSRALSTGRMDGIATQHVSMLGANTAEAAIEVHSFLSVLDDMEVFIEESNDRSNWFFAEQIGTQITAAGSFSVKALGVGMAWVRVLFILDKGSGNPSGTASVSCILTTSLL